MRDINKLRKKSVSTVGRGENISVLFIRDRFDLNSLTSTDSTMQNGNSKAFSVQVDLGGGEWEWSLKAWLALVLYVTATSGQE